MNLTDDGGHPPTILVGAADMRLRVGFHKLVIILSFVMGHKYRGT
jgi:hypothetical protein